MPLSVNVGLSRKASKDYQSIGYSINVSAELDQALLARPDDLQAQVANLYLQAQLALDRQAAGSPGQDHPATQPSRQESPPRANGNGNGAARGNGRVVGATESQKRAIQAICRRLGTDAEYEAQQLIGLPFLSLSIKQASELIDSLKAVEPPEAASAGRNGGGR